MKKISVKTWILTGVMFVLVTLATWLLRVDVRVAEQLAGYWTMGDVAVYAAAALLGGPLGALAAGLGSALADILAGQAVYAPASLIIKALTALLCAFLLKRGNDRDWLYLVKVACLCGGGMILLYFLYDLVFRGDYLVAALGLPFNVLQLVASGVVAVPVLKILRRKSYDQAGLPTGSAETNGRQLK